MTTDALRITERAYISGILYEPSMLDDGVRVPAEAIWHASERDLYRALVAVYDATQGVEMISVVERCAQDASEAIRLYGDLMADAYTSMHTEGHARRIRSAHLRRQIHGRVKALMVMCERGDDVQHITEAIRDLASMATDEDAPDLVPITVVAKEAVARLERSAQGLEPSGIDSPILGADDSVFWPYRPGELVVIAGRPGMGKTALALNEMCDLARAGHEGLLVTLEMPGADLVEREISRQSGLSSSAMRCMSDDMQWTSFFNGVKSIHALPMHVNADFRGGVSVSQIESWVRRISRRRDLRFVAIDFLTRMKIGESERRSLAVGNVANRLKDLALEAKITILLLAQLNRSVEARADKRPQLSDLKESGDIEEAADRVVLMYRPAYYPGLSAAPDEATAILAKHRGGPTGEIPLVWDGSTTSFAPLTQSFSPTIYP